MAYEANHWVPDEIITTPKMNNIEDGLLEVSERALYGHGGADQASEGIHSLVYVDKGNPMPSNPTVGDTVFVRDGSDFVLMEWNGEEWVPRINPDLTNRLQENLNKANEATQTAIETNNISINETIEQVAKEQADLAIKDGDFINKAQAMADKALSDAKADSTTKANKALSDAKAALNTAKTDLNSSIQKEITDRTNSVTALDTKAQGYVAQAKADLNGTISSAVSDADTKAQGYATQAKTDAITAAKTADGVISKKIDDTASSLSLTIGQNKTDADGKISTVSANVTVALDQIKTKVSQTDYDKKTGDLTTQLNTTTTTANQSKQDIVAIKETTSAQASQINSIESDASGTKQSISDILKKDGEQDTRIGTIETTASGIKTDFSEYKTSNDGKVQNAQTTAQNAVDGLKTKVSQTDYDKKTGDLTTQINTTSQTATQSKQDIVDIKAKDNSQDARMLSIENDATGTKTTVSDLKKTSDTQSGNISILQQRADGFESTVTKVNNLSTGDRNYILDTVNPKKQVSNGKDNQDIYNSAIFYDPIKNWGVASGDYIISFDWNLTTALSEDMSAGVFFNQSPWQQQIYTVKAGQTKGHVICKLKLMPALLSSNPDVTGLTFRVHHQMASGNTITYSNLFMKSGTLDTSWTPAPEDLSSATSKAQQTAEQALTQLNTYKTDADGRITKAQTDITATANQVATKVSQTIFDSKTGELSVAASNAQQTANTARTEIANYKTEANGKLSSQQSAIDQNASKIALSATKTELDAAKTDYNAKVAQINLDVDKVETRVSQVQTKMNSMGQINQLSNTEFNPDFAGWYTKYPNPSSTNAVKTEFTWLGTDGFGSNRVSHKGNGSWINSAPIPVQPGMTVSFSARLFAPKSVSSGTPIALYIMAFDAAGNRTLSNGYNIPLAPLSASSSVYKRENVTIPDKSVAAYAVFGWNVVDEVYISQPMFVFGSTVGDYVQGSYSSNDRIAAQQITIDGITNTVSKQTSDINAITSRVQTAEGNLSTATNNISGLQSSQTQTANQIAQEIKDRTTGDSNTLQSSKDFTTSNITSAVNGVNTTITQTANGILNQVESTNMVINSEFDPLNGTWFEFLNQNSVGNAWNAPQTGGFQDWPVVNGSRIISYSQAAWYTSTLMVASVGKVFSASIVAGRSPAPSVSTALDFRIGFWDANRKIISTASAGNIIDGTAYKGIQKYIVENKVAPANTKFVSVLICHSSGNAVDYITRPSLNIGAKVAPYTPTYGLSASSTVLSLFKDNWSIGLADNMNKIVSGIVADTGSMSLISDKVIIKSPNTQITGTAWITSAMIGDAQIKAANIADAAINSAKISELDVSKLSGNVSSFIQTNWDGLYKSVQITPIGMTITTNKNGSSIAQFNQDGLLLDGPLGVTNILNGSIELTSDRNEYIGSFSRETMINQDNVDYLMIKVAGWHTSKQGDNEWDLDTSINNTIRGGDGIGFAVTNAVGTYDMKMSWDSALIAGYKSRKMGWHVEDLFTTHQKAYFENGFEFSEMYNGSKMALHTQAATLSNGNKWYGFFDGNSKAGFGTDPTQDVIFYVKGKSYSLYTMLSKLSML